MLRDGGIPAMTGLRNDPCLILLLTADILVQFSNEDEHGKRKSSSFHALSNELSLP